MLAVCHDVLQDRSKVVSHFSPQIRIEIIE